MLGRDVFCRSILLRNEVSDPKRYHLFFVLLVLLFLLTCLFSYPDAYSNIPKKVTDEVARYIPITLQSSSPTIVTSNFQNSHLKTREDPYFAFNSSDCPTEEWNNIRTSSIPNSKLHREWLDKKLKTIKYLYHTSPSVLAAFVHKDQIIVTLTSENQYNTTVYCRYYDCRRGEISDHFESVIFPQSTVFCARRPGAKYISISKTLKENPEYSVPIVPRTQRPPHYFTVCMATLYGDEPKFLQIVDFIEYYKLQGATFFHIYLRNVTDYDRVLLDDYVRTGDIEIIKMHDHYWRDDFMWHNSQINVRIILETTFISCFRIVIIETNTFLNGRHTVHNSSIVNLHFLVQWVIKQNNTPARYESDEQLIREMIFHKYQNTSKVGDLWNQPKCIIRPEKIGAMTIHLPTAVYEGEQFTPVPPSVGVVRHYRNVEQRVFAGALQRMMSHGPFTLLPIPHWIDEELTKTIVRRVKWVYNPVDVECIKKQRTYNIHGGISAPCWLEEQAMND
ncbi:hypothetical protein GCK72_018760 [Caenorhabditis remanei]|uniref:Glycosyltransferase family 92 protein n=1 Tax=Caenorhabditis remanei TaxID=31234 RepID=A0A6A5GBH0_CAERE|nr:hypothetical protein GCK72_018760 [Caenorhabditis remanei]KAF1752206.1 hypothetical protein GCK72_018760 [Caenorhabditis remanei]